jgi:predicted dehydrogenase
MQRKTTIAQLGCGYWGPNLLRNFASQPLCSVKYLVELNPERRAYVETNHPGVQVIADFEQALKDDEVDAVVIATPASTHHHLAMAALQADKHIFVEKPLAMSSRDADEIVAAAEARKRIVMVGHTFLYNAAVQYVKKLMKDDQFGETYYICSQRLNLGQVRQDVNAWWNLAPHDVSILVHLMDEQLPVSVSATGKDYIQKGIEDVVFATLTWANGVTGHIHVSWLDPGKVRRMTLVGSRKMVVYDDVSDDKIAIYDKGVDKIPKIGERMDYDARADYRLLHRWGDVLLPRVDFKEPLKVESGHFIDCIRNNKAPITGGDHARRVVRVLEAAQRSIKEGGCSVAISN